MISFWKKRPVSVPARTQHSSRPLDYQPLEPRFMFDGAVAQTVADAHAAAAVAAKPTADAAPAHHADNDTATARPVAATADVRATDATAGKEVVFVDTTVNNYQQLVNALRPGVEVVLLDSSRDGLGQVADWAGSHQGYSALHIISHGGEGTLQLGSTLINATTLAQAGQSALLARIGESLTRDGDILLYGCDVAEGADGAAFVQTLAQLTHADIEASTDASGGTARGGNWTLEYQTGSIEARSVLDTPLAADADVLLALPSNGSKDVTPSMDVGTGNFVAGFSLAASAALGHDDASALYLNIADGTTTPGSFTVSADGTNLARFDLTGLAFTNPNLDGSFVLTITGTKADISTVTTTVSTQDGSGVFTSGNYTAFTGLTRFTINIASDTSGGSFGVNNVRFDAFTIANAVAPTTNTVPSLSATGGSHSYVESASAVSLFSSTVASTNDSGQTFSGLTLTVSNVTDGSAELLGIGGSTLTLSNGATGSVLGGGSYSVALAGTTATVTVSGLTRTDAQMQTLINSIAYRDSSNDPTAASRTVTLTRVTDSGTSNNLTNLAVTSTVNVVAVNNVPTLTSTALNPTFTEDGAAVPVFSGTTISTVESTQSIIAINLQVAGVHDGANEVVTIDGTAVALTNGNSVTTANHGVSVAVALVGTTATISVSGTGMPVSIAQALINGATYRDLSHTPTSGTRTATITSVRDNGGTANGGVDTASLAVVSTIRVVAVNDAPTISGSVVLAATNEDTTTPGATVSSLLSSTGYADLDGSGPSGIAVVGLTGDGAWQYSTDGTSWVAVGTVSASSALLLNSTTQLRYAPDGANGETPTLTFRGWDQSTGTASTNASRNTGNTTSNGGTTAFSSATAQATLSVASVNDAPSLTPSAPTLISINEDATTNSGQTVASILGASVTDPDTGAVGGIALVATQSGNGTWQFSTDGGGSWSAVGVVSTSSALLLRSTDSVRFIPDSITGTTASLTYRAWDQTGATVGEQGSKVLIGSTGGTTAFSANSDIATLTVSDVDDAPVAVASSGSAAFTGIGARATAVVVDSGMALSDVDNSTLASATVSIGSGFENGDVLRLASPNNPAYGNISSSYDSGSGVLTLISSGSTASLAQFQAALRDVQFVNTNPSLGTATRTIAFVVNDGIDSSVTVTRSVSVTQLDPTPHVIIGGSSVGYTSTGSSSGALLLAPGLTLTDAYTGTLASAAVAFSAGKAGGDTLSFSNDGLTMGDIRAGYDANSGTLTLTSASATATLAQWQAALRSVTYANTEALPSTAPRTLAFTASDGTYSSAAASLTVSVVHLNAAPTLIAPLTLSGTEDTALTLSGISFADTDANGSALSVTLNVASGALSTMASGAVTVSGNGTSVLVLNASLADLNALFASGQVHYTPASNANGDIVLDVTVNDGGNTGSGGAKTTTTQITLQLADVNDAPLLTPSAPTLISINEDATTNSGQTVASILGNSVTDPDANALQGIALYATHAGNGTWQYSVDGATTWSNVGVVAPGSALLLRSSDSLRFVPNGISGTSASLTYVAWDQTGATAGQQGSKAAVISTGEGAFSASSDSANLTVTDVNDAPVLTSSVGGSVFVSRGTDSSPVVIDAGLTVTDVDSTSLSSATVVISGNFMAGDRLQFTNEPATMGNITASYDGNQGLLTLNSLGATASLAQWQAALRSVTFQNTELNPSTATRTLGLQVNDGQSPSATVFRAVEVQPFISVPDTGVPGVTPPVVTTLEQVRTVDRDADGAIGPSALPYEPLRRIPGPSEEVWDGEVAAAGTVGSLLAAPFHTVAGTSALVALPPVSMLSSIFPEPSALTIQMEVLREGEWALVAASPGLNEAAPTLDQQLQRLHEKRHQAQTDLLHFLKTPD